ncbi:MAG: zinc-dependent alcohol dehydrogenase family protein [Oligoflexia bacterium]|nr:zinc-dependent alcohol dehydrogenase family protein [Oligoflexia bacterium]
MRALAFEGPGKRAFIEKPKPVVQEATDAVVRITKTTICGTDLHILKGDVPTVTPGRILGHEGVGVIDSVGDAVTSFKPGDRVLISCITSDGRCEACRKAMYSHCERGGWILGNRIDGTQAEFVRIPFADTSLYRAPAGVDEEALVLLSDILPTGYECGVLNGKVKPGDTVAIVGAGPIGLASLLTAQFYAPAELIMIDVDDKRLERSKQFGATHILNSRRDDAAKQVLELTGNRGVEVAIEAVGIPATFDLCQNILAPGGHLANVGVHGKSAELRLEKLWDRNITITTRLVDTETTPLLLKTIASGKLHPEKLITHRFRLDEVMKAYDVFENAAREGALKVLISAD